LSDIWIPPDAELGTVEQPVSGFEEWAMAHGYSGVALQGDTPFSVPLVSQILPNLIMGGCIDSLMLPGSAGINHVISLYPWEKYKLTPGVSRLEYALMDSNDEIDGHRIAAIADWMGTLEGTMLVHCQAGLNRSSLVTAFYMVKHCDMEPKDAINLIRERRSSACLCNATFEKWLLEECELYV
jgi:hypothetical protein